MPNCFKYRRRCIDVAVHGHQVALDQLRLPRRQQADGDICLAHAEVELAVVEHQIDRDIRIDLDELADARRKPGRAEADGRGDLQLALGALFALRQLRLGHRQLGEDFARRCDRAARPVR